MNTNKCKRVQSSFVSIRVYSWSICLLFLFVVGCASDTNSPTTRPATARERQEAALRDPMGYSPDMDSPENDISGGKLHELDRKAMRKDIDHVLNP